MKYDINDIKIRLFSKKSEERRSAAKKINKYLIKDLEEDLYQAYIKERKDIRTWETQCEMIKALGKLNNKAIVPELIKIIDANKNDDLITNVASCAYVRITQSEKNDMSSIISLLKGGNLSVLTGAASALAFDEMIPEKMQAQEIIRIMLNREAEITELCGQGSIDPRALILSSIIKWDKTDPLVKKFVERCLKLDSIKTDPYIIERFIANKKIYSE